MKGFLALAALIGAAVAVPAPQASTPAGCESSKSGQFQISIVNVTRSAKRDLASRQLDGVLMLTLQGGILKDQAGRTGYIAANRQFQFDAPIQAGAVITSGWSACGNGSLSLGGSSIFYSCLSGNFYNLYDRSQGGQCFPIYIVAQGGAGAATVLSDGQPQATTRVTQLSDGQPQATSVAAPVTQISDGQIQATTATRPAVTQISDGQIQATTGTASSTRAPVTQISDGQIQATTGRATTTTRAPVTQISDGQIQATTGRATTTRPAVSQISDGQIQAPTSSAPIATFTGAAHRELAGGFAFVAGVAGAIALL